MKLSGAWSVRHFRVNVCKIANCAWNVQILCCNLIWCGVIYCQGPVIWCSVAKYLSNGSNLLSHSQLRRMKFAQTLPEMLLKIGNIQESLSGADINKQTQGDPQSCWLWFGWIWYQLSVALTQSIRIMFTRCIYFKHIFIYPLFEDLYHWKVSVDKWNKNLLPRPLDNCSIWGEKLWASVGVRLSGSSWETQSSSCLKPPDVCWSPHVLWGYWVTSSHTKTPRQPRALNFTLLSPAQPSLASIR